MNLGLWRLAIALIVTIALASCVEAQQQKAGEAQTLPLPTQTSSDTLQFEPEALIENMMEGLEQVAIRLPWAAVGSYVTP